MLYVKAIDSQIVAYPYTQTDLIRDNPSTSFPSGGISPDSLAEWNVFPVHFADQPGVDPLAQRVVELAPMYDGQSWIQQWAVEALSQDEINANAAQQAAAVRADRNARPAPFQAAQCHRRHAGSLRDLLCRQPPALARQPQPLPQPAQVVFSRTQQRCSSIAHNGSIMALGYRKRQNNIVWNRKF